MNRIEEILLTDLRHLIHDLGKGGGLIGPSVYDTAQVLRMAPPQEGIWDALDWIMEQQHPDGGWGDTATPLARDVPTLAAMLALHVYGTRGGERLSLQIGLSFIKRQALHWMPPLSDDLPVGVELLLPSLLEEALAM